MTLTPRQSRRVATLLGLLILLLVLIAQFSPLSGLQRLTQRLEMLTYDLRLQLHLPQTAEPDWRIVIIDIDEASLQQEGRWPWSRQRIATLVEELHRAGAAIIGFDVLFAEPERNPAEQIAAAIAGDPDSEGLSQQLHALAPRFDADTLLAAQQAQAEVVLGYTFNPDRPLRSGQLPSPLSLSDSADVASLPLSAMRGYSAPLPILQQHAAGSGFFSLQPDHDGIVRRAPLLARYEDELYASLSLAILKRLFFVESLRLETALIDEQHRIEAIHLDANLRIPTDGMGQMLIPFRGPKGSFPYLPAHRVLSGDYDPQRLAGAIVLVGTTTPGLFDLRATPVDEVYPGVEVHANLLAGFLDERFLHEPPWARGANFLIALLSGLWLVLLMPRLSPSGMLLLSLGTAGAVVLSTTWFWQQHGLVLALAGPLWLIATLTVGNLAWGFFSESVTRHHLKDMFGQYVPPELVDEMSEEPHEFGFDGESRELSVLFADIRHFTSISESLDAYELKRLLNHYFTPMTRLIFEQRGTIDKYVGDMIMAFWGAPVSNEDHALHAIDTALAMLQETERLKPEFAARGWPEINIGIGINSGIMNVGDMGSEYRRAYTVLGDAVNLASRLEGSTKYYGVGLVVGERTRELAAGHFLFRELDRVRVKGKQQAITVYQPLCRVEQAEQAMRDELAQYHHALALYRQREWDQASALFDQLRQHSPATGLYALYQQRIDECRQLQLDEDWDGVVVRDSK